MYLKSDNIDILLDGVNFRSFRRGTDWELVLDPEAISGWYDGASVRRDGTVRPNQWGDFSDQGRKASRVVTLTGTATASSIANLQTARDRFTGLLQDGSYKEMKVSTDNEERFINVGLEGTPSWVRLSDTVATWKIDFYAPNPRIYGTVNRVPIGDGTQSGGLSYPLSFPLNYGGPIINKAIYIANAGNVESWPTFTVRGDYPLGFHLKNNNGKVVTYMGVVSQLSPVTIDMAAGNAMQNGSDRSTNLTNRAWFSIPPRSSIRPSFEPIQDGAGSCDIMYRDTWI